MDAVTMLKQDHKKVKELFKDYEGAGEHAHQKKQQIVGQALQELEIHSKLEEEIFYPAVKEKATKALDAVIAESYEEHAIVDRLVEELKTLAADDAQYHAKVQVLMENVRHHIEEEETELLPDAQQRLGKENETLGFRMAERKQQLQQQAGVAAH